MSEKKAPKKPEAAEAKESKGETNPRVAQLTSDVTQPEKGGGTKAYGKHATMPVRRSMPIAFAYSLTPIPSHRLSSSSTGSKVASSSACTIAGESGTVGISSKPRKSMPPLGATFCFLAVRGAAMSNRAIGTASRRERPRRVTCHSDVSATIHLFMNSPNSNTHSRPGTGLSCLKGCIVIVRSAPGYSPRTRSRGPKLRTPEGSKARANRIG